MISIPILTSGVSYDNLVKVIPARYLLQRYVLPFVINKYFFRERFWKYVKSYSVHYHTLSLTVIDISHMYYYNDANCQMMILIFLLPSYFLLEERVLSSPNISLIYLCQLDLKISIWFNYLFWCSDNPRVGQWELLPTGIYALHHSLSICLHPGTKYSRLILSCPCPSPGISHFSLEPW